MDDTAAFLQSLRKRGYKTVFGGRHIKIYKNGVYVCTSSITPRGGNRSLENLKATVRRFERRQQKPAV